MWGATVCRGLDFWGASVCGGLLAIMDFGGLVCLSPIKLPFDAEVAEKILNVI